MLLSWTIRLTPKGRRPSAPVERSPVLDAMNADESHIDDVVLALLLLGLNDGRGAWKLFDWDAFDRLHANGLISNSFGKAAAA